MKAGTTKQAGGGIDAVRPSQPGRPRGGWAAHLLGIDILNDANAEPGTADPRQKGDAMNKASIIFATGETLNIGDTFYYVHPEYHDGTIEEFTVDSFWPGDTQYGIRIRCTSKKRCEWLFVHQQFFERAHPTCFVRYDDAKDRTNNQLYCFR